jgi:hypothetical protein
MAALARRQAVSACRPTRPQWNFPSNCVEAGEEAVGVMHSPARIDSITASSF